MSNTFSALKQARSKEFEKLNAQLQNLNSNNASKDDDYWKLEVDKSGNGYAIIRFLPAAKNEEMPFVTVWDHGFQGPGGWYIENSLTTLKQPDPVSEYNTKLWNSGVESDKDIVRKQKRRLSFHSNIYVVKDPANPANEGKVFKFKYGKKIFDKLNDLMNPQYEDEKAINPFDFWEGADFKLKARLVEGYRNYDKSEFTASGALTKPNGTPMTDEELEQVWNQQYSLQEIIDPKNFKSYEELKTKLYKVLALDGGSHAPTRTAEDDDVEEMNFTPKFKESSPKSMGQASSPSAIAEEDDDDLSFFRNLAD